MSLLSGSMILARLGWLRLLRGKTLYVTLLLALVPIALAAIEDGTQPKGAWDAAVEAVLRFVVPLGAAIHVSGAVGEELDQKTFTYLWSRPLPRSAVVVGRLIVMTPLLFALAALSMLVSYAFATRSGATMDDLVRGLGAVFASALTCSFFAAGGGAMFPRQPMLFTMGVFLTVEQVLFAIPAAKNLSIVAHTRVIAGLEGNDASVGGALLGLLFLGVAWLGMGLFRVNNAEFAAAKE